MNKVHRYICTAFASVALCSCVKVVDAPVPGERPQRPEGPANAESAFNVSRMSVTGANVNWVDGKTQQSPLTPRRVF